MARSSLLARMSTACSPDQAMDAPTPRKSNRVPISLAAWLSALSTSWRSSLDTMSKEESWDATAPRLDARTAGRHAERAGRRARYDPDGPSANRLVVSWAILFDAARATAHGRLPEWPKGAVCKTVGSAYVGSNPTPATRFRRSEPVTRDCVTGFPAQRERLRRPSAVSLGPCVGQIRPSAAAVRGAT